MERVPRVVGVGQELLVHAVELELNELLMLNPPASNPYPLREVCGCGNLLRRLLLVDLTWL